jgi:hypothetical protein
MHCGLSDSLVEGTTRPMQYGLIYTYINVLTKLRVSDKNRKQNFSLSANLNGAAKFYSVSSAEGAFPTKQDLLTPLGIAAYALHRFSLKVHHMLV